VSKLDTNHFRARLEELRSELQGQDEALPIGGDEDESTDGSAGQHYADDGTDTFLRERNLALRDNAADLLAQVDGALKRIEAGTFGTCENCGRPISAERLEALPYTAYCIDCASQIQAAASAAAR
jgi:DnaK suppressor protein